MVSRLTFMGLIFCTASLASAQMSITEDGKTATLDQTHTVSIASSQDTIDGVTTTSSTSTAPATSVSYAQAAVAATTTTTPTGTALTGCKDLTASGSYYLAKNVSSSGTCFLIDANNISLNLNGHTITYATSGGSKPSPGIVLADPWFTDIATTGTTYYHSGFLVFNGYIVEGKKGANQSAGIWLGESNGVTPPPTIHDVTFTTYSTDAAAIYAEYGPSGWNIYNNTISMLAGTASNRDEFTGVAINLVQGGGGTAVDQIHNNKILHATQGGILDAHANAKIYHNDIAFNSFTSNDFCITIPSPGQEVYTNYCHPNSGRGIHVNASNVNIHDNIIVVRELKQNVEYGGCELGGAYAIQLEYDTFNPIPTGVVIQNNTISAIAGDCDAAGLRITDIPPSGTAQFIGNNVTTTNTGKAGHDRSIYIGGAQVGANMIKWISNTFNSQYAYMGSGWEGAYVAVPSGQTWNGTPIYALDDQDGALAPNGPTFSQALTIDDLLTRPVNCGTWANSIDRVGNKSTNCH
jgi:hypothetical protein